MKIAIISPLIIGIGQTPTTYSSQEINLAQCWANQGHDVDVITSWFEGIYEALQHKHIRVMVRPLVWLGGKTGLPLLIGGGGVLLKEHYDFVLSGEHYYPNTALSCLLTTKVVIYQGQNTPGSTWWKRLGLYILDALFLPITRRRYLKVVAKTRQAEEFIRRKGFHRTVTIPVAYDSTRFRMPTAGERAMCREFLGLSDDLGVLVYAGNLLPRRDVGTAIRALARLRHGGEKVALLIAGEGPDKDALKSIVETENLQHHVRFLGLLPWEKLRQVYWAGDVFVFPSLYEIFGMVQIEALASGVNLVSTPCPAIVDLVAEGNEFVKIVPPSDVLAFAEACGAMLARRRSGQDAADASSQILAKMDWPSVSQRIIEAVVS
jgi:glycosyltransferase involved in cell wall biosynthesis